MKFSKQRSRPPQAAQSGRVIHVRRAEVKGSIVLIIVSIRHQAHMLIEWGPRNVVAVRPKLIQHQTRRLGTITRTALTFGNSFQIAARRPSVNTDLSMRIFMS
jgi:hypothetical protein